MAMDKLGNYIYMSDIGQISTQLSRYDALDHTAPSVLRIAANDSIIGGFTIINSPRAHLNVTNSTNLVLHDFILHTVSNNSYLPKNTDALDLYHSSGITFKDSMLTVGDDCVAIKEGNVHSL